MSRPVTRPRCYLIISEYASDPFNKCAYITHDKEQAEQYLKDAEVSASRIMELLGASRERAEEVQKEANEERIITLHVLDNIHIDMWMQSFNERDDQ